MTAAGVVWLQLHRKRLGASRQSRAAAIQAFPAQEISTRLKLYSSPEPCCCVLLQLNSRHCQVVYETGETEELLVEELIRDGIMCIEYVSEGGRPESAGQLSVAGESPPRKRHCPTNEAPCFGVVRRVYGMSRV